MEPTSHYDNIDYQALVNVIDGVATAAETRLVNEWLEKSEQNRALYFSIKDILDYRRAAEMEIDTARAWDAVAGKLEAKRQRKKWPVLRYAAMLAVLLLAGGTAFYFFGNKPTVTGMEEVLVVSDTVQQVVLPDSTRVWVNKGGRLRYRESFGKTDRDVWIEGTAFFEVSEHAQPFIVHGDSVQVKVLATSFTVQANALVHSVTVNNGKVKAMYAAEELIVLPDERVVMNGGKMTKTKVNAALFSAWRNGEYLFNNTGIEELKDVIRSNYGLDVKVENPQAFKGSAISGVLVIAGEESLVAVLEGTLNASAKINKRTLTIQPK